MRKLCETLRQAMEQAGLRDGMTISFHHHLRNGDYVLNMVLDEAAKMGVKDLTVNASSVFDCYEPMLDHIRNGVVTGLETDYIAPGIGRGAEQGHPAQTHHLPHAWLPPGGHSQRAQPHRHCLYCSSGVRFYGQLLGQVRPVGLRLAGLRLCRRHEGKKSGGHHRPPDGLSSDGRLHH